MSRNLAKAMLRLYEAGGKGKPGATLVMEALNKKKFNIKDVSIKALAIEAMGDQWFESLTPDRTERVRFLESAVDSTAFLNLANVVLSGKVIQEFDEADFNVADQYAETRSEPYIQSGRDIEVTRTDAKSNVVLEGRSFPRWGLGENWKTYPDTVKRGGIVELTKEAISEDRTGTLLKQAGTVANEVAMEKNERILKVVLGIDDNLYFPQGAAAATYTASAPRKNLLTGNELVDWTKVDAALLLWAQMAHPVTGRPVSPPPGERDILVMPSKIATAQYILGATGLSVGDADSGSATGITHGVNPIAGLLSRNGLSQTVKASELAYYLLTLAAASGGGGVSASDAAKYWFLGSFKRAFVYRENYPLTISTQGAGTPDEFDRDVLFSIKAAERGVMAVQEPRFVIKCTG